MFFIPAAATRVVVGARLRRIALAPLLLFGCVVPEAADEASRAARSGHERMLRELAAIAERTPEESLYLGDRRARELRAEIDSLPAATPAIARWQLHLELGEAELRLGNDREAVHQLEIAFALVSELAGRLPAERVDYVHYRLAVAHFRVAERQNCHHDLNEESCILPLTARARHRLGESTRLAVEHLTALLPGLEAASPLALRARWLLNLAHQALGSHPDGVPRPYQIDFDSRSGEEDWPRLRNVAPELGLDVFDISGGAIGDDFDGDGDLDLVVSTADTRGPMRLFRNRGDGTFTDATSAAGLDGLFGGLNLEQADYDNDGDLDILVLRGAWLFEAGRHPNSLLQNQGNGAFRDVTFESGLGDESYPTQTAAWADYDNDGDLDLYVGNETSQRLRAPSQLFRNRGDGRFEEVAEQAGVQNLRFTKGVAWGDCDRDGRPDLHVSNLGAPNRLFRNRGDGAFDDVTAAAGVAEPIQSFATWFFDVDNDGTLDLFVASFDEKLAPVAAHYLGWPSDAQPPALYRGLGGCRFEAVGREMGLVAFFPVMGANFGDLDSDGFLDLYLGTGAPDFDNLVPNIFYRNRAGKSFSDVTLALGVGHLQKGHAVVFADFDEDGDQDLFEQMGGAFASDGFANALYENPGLGGRAVVVRLVGTRSNRSAIGAWIRADVSDGARERSLHRVVGSGGSFGANPLRQTLGLGAAERIER
ncbi:MAG: VCBS repeat-containing protein, partial [Thermoanaerobaculia bacterium]|nr:VCBS repeat-containing protein [Thermoanaerobaculia bacterium]